MASQSENEVTPLHLVALTCEPLLVPRYECCPGSLTRKPKYLTMIPTTYTLNSQPSTLSTKPSTLNPQPTHARPSCTATVDLCRIASSSSSLLSIQVLQGPCALS